MDPIVPARLAPPPAATPEVRRVRQTAQDFEALVVQHLLRTMRQASPGTPDGQGGMRAYRDLMDEELARSLARSGGLGLADVIVRDLVRRTEKTPQAPPPAGR